MTIEEKSKIDKIMIDTESTINMVANLLLGESPVTKPDLLKVGKYLSNINIGLIKLKKGD